ncbi:hypothetical protein EES43_24210 [Streptomyces sp. ADI96-02]|uniref:hypothetical protein n=1 Tax=Streptomyces sp. ADI96-02 TaxID=1522760 RepID=UPI000F54C7C4|nr:hypothetical protein [Streptomyces sp. ADI96-02]RPK56148.1 hypothetical protein EES43_24210 [Streptomyces sp. ADI96-02]
MNADRTEYIAGLRQLATWLEENPSVRVSSDERFLVPLHTNTAVEEFAAEHSLPVVMDDEGNKSAQMQFGPITYYAYGYVDFAQHTAEMDERRARKWADEQGMELRETEATA